METAELLQDELRKLFAKAKIPTSPALAVRILELAEDPDSTVDQFAYLIQMDPALSARLLSLTNSAAFAQRKQVTTIQRAVNLLGISRVRTISLGFQLVGHLGRLGGCPFDMKRFWQYSLLRACINREFAEALAPSCADEAFLIGLLQDCGILLLVQLLGQPYADLCSQAELTPKAFLAAEKAQFPHNHVDMTTAMAREWKLPEPIIEKLAEHHTEKTLDPDAHDGDRLSAINYLVSSLHLHDNNEFYRDDGLAGYARETLGIGDDILQTCLNKAAETYTEMALLIQENVPEDLDVTDLLSQANTQLCLSVENERIRSDEEQAHLEIALGEYRELAARDPLTGILNRGALVAAGRQCIQDALDENSPVVVLFLDIDDFKQINDSLGHEAGDMVLKGVVATLKSCVPNAGHIGRYGGEEFVVVVMRLSESQAAALAQQIVDAVRETQLPGLGLKRPITCSLGSAWVVPDVETTIESLIGLADDLMYQGKRAGKNCCRLYPPLKEALPTDLHAAERAIGPGAGPAPHVSIEEFKRIAARLERKTQTGFLDVRKQARKRVMTTCRMTTLLCHNLTLESDEAFVRNISTGGVGLLTSRVIDRGQPIEIAVQVADKPTHYIAGLVAFCRHVEGAVYEVGIQIFTHAQQPILSVDPINAIRNLDWIAAATETGRPPTPASSSGAACS